MMGAPTVEETLANKNVTGLTPASIATLKALGAVED
jgi:hypothetical protein